MKPISASFSAVKRDTSDRRQPFLPSRAPDAGSTSSIGAILVDTGRLSPENVDRVLQLQIKQDKRFGDAAIELGLLSEDDVRFALSRQFNDLYLPAGDNSLNYQLVAAYQPFSLIVEKLRGLRSQLMLRWFDPDAERNMLAIVSPGVGEGRSFIAANLAIVFSQLGKRTLLVDANLRTPRQHELFKLGVNAAGLSSLLSGRMYSEGIVRISALPGLSVLPAGAVPPNPQELIGRPAFAELLESLGTEFDIVIIDTPAASEHAEAQIIVSKVSAALIVVRRGRTSMPETVELARSLQQTGAATVGSVLNDF